MFLGTFTPKLLNTGQMSLPAKIRNGLTGERAILTSGFETCVYGFSHEEWEKISTQELTKPLSTGEGRQIRRQMFGMATEVELDDQGRFVVPEFLRAYAKLSENVLVIGAGDHFEIWNEAEFTRISNEVTRT